LLLSLALFPDLRRCPVTRSVRFFQASLFFYTGIVGSRFPVQLRLNSLDQQQQQHPSTRCFYFHFTEIPSVIKPFGAFPDRIRYPLIIITTILFNNNININSTSTSSP
jgi:hypothetical protein